MKEHIDILDSADTPLYDLFGFKRKFYMTEDKAIIEMFDDTAEMLLLPMFDLNEKDIKRFKQFLSKTFPGKSKKLIEVCIATRGQLRGIFGGFDRDPALETCP